MVLRRLLFWGVWGCILHLLDPYSGFDPDCEYTGPDYPDSMEMDDCLHLAGGYETAMDYSGSDYADTTDRAIESEPPVNRDTQVHSELDCMDCTDSESDCMDRTNSDDESDSTEFTYYGDESEGTYFADSDDE